MGTEQSSGKRFRKPDEAPSPLVQPRHAAPSHAAPAPTPAPAEKNPQVASAAAAPQPAATSPDLTAPQPVQPATSTLPAVETAATPGFSASPSTAAVPAAAPLMGATQAFEPVLGDAPAPAPVENTQAFGTVAAGDAPVVTTRDTAEEARLTHAHAGGATAAQSRLVGAHRPHVAARKQAGVPKRALAIILVAVVVVAVAVGVLWATGANNAATSDNAATTKTDQLEDALATGIQYDGYTYQTVMLQDGTWWFARTSDGASDPLYLFQLEGTPAALMLYGGAFIIPENLAGDTWDVMAYQLGDGSIPMKITTPEGATVGGTGVIASAAIEGTTLTLAMQDGSTQAVALA